MFLVKFLFWDFGQDETWGLVWPQGSLFKMSPKMNENNSDAGCFNFLLTIITSPADRVDTESCPVKGVYVSGSKKDLRERR